MPNVCLLLIVFRMLEQSSGCHLFQGNGSSGCIARRSNNLKSLSSGRSSLKLMMGTRAAGGMIVNLHGFSCIALYPLRVYITDNNLNSFGRSSLKLMMGITTYKSG